MPAARQVQREWLDELSASDPRAIRSRRDLARVNAWMLQPGIMAKALLKYHPTDAPRTILDLGTGDGTFMLRVAKLLSRRWRSVGVVMLDRLDIVEKSTREGFRAIGWSGRTLVGDLSDVVAKGTLPRADIVTANLFLHHFPQPQLAQLLARVAPLAPLFVACEPRRGSLPLLGSRLLWLIGCNDVTRHDSVVSVQAGFDGSEIAAVWPEPGRWQIHEYAARLFTHCFVARRASESLRYEV